LIGAIESGEMRNPLPGEVQLSERLKVSRPTLRRAIAILAKKGLVETAKGKRTRIVSRKAKGPVKVASVCFIVSAPLHSAATMVSSLLDEVKFELTAEGVAWDSIYESQLGGSRPEARLKEIVAGRRGACYVLLNSSRILQHWFANSGEPVLVMGSCHEGVELPSIDLDYRAVGWHAGGQFVKNGHKNILLVEPVGNLVGFSASEAALREYMAGVPGSQVRVLQATQSSFLQAFERALRGPNAPTAALACRVEMALSVLGAAQQFGKSIPKDFALVSRDYHPIFQVMAPEVTRYEANLHAMARKTIRLIHPLLQGIAPRNKTTLIFPTFFPGQTLRSL
jgi:DNA-binding LacI/PurR family transcriptional regulator